MLTEQSNTLECPQCGKKVLVQENGTKYTCLWCDFNRDLTPVLKQADKTLPFFSVLALMAFVLLLVL